MQQFSSDVETSAPFKNGRRLKPSASYLQMTSWQKKNATSKMFWTWRRNYPEKLLDAASFAGLDFWLRLFVLKCSQTKEGSWRNPKLLSKSCFGQQTLGITGLVASGSETWDPLAPLSLVTRGTGLQGWAGQKKPYTPSGTSGVLWLVKTRVNQKWILTWFRRGAMRGFLNVQFNPKAKGVQCFVMIFSSWATLNIWTSMGDKPFVNLVQNLLSVGT